MSILANSEPVQGTGMTMTLTSTSHIPPESNRMETVAAGVRQECKRNAEIKGRGSEAG